PTFVFARRRVGRLRLPLGDPFVERAVAIAIERGELEHRADLARTRHGDDRGLLDRILLRRRRLVGIFARRRRRSARRRVRGLLHRRGDRRLGRLLLLSAGIEVRVRRRGDAEQPGEREHDERTETAHGGSSIGHGRRPVLRASWRVPKLNARTPDRASAADPLSLLLGWITSRSSPRAWSSGGSIGSIASSRPAAWAPAIRGSTPRR